MSRTSRINNALGFLLLWPATLYADVGSGVSSTAGTAPGFWQWNTLVYAEVRGISRTPSLDRPYLLDLNVIATLRGHMDPAENCCISAWAEFLRPTLAGDPKCPSRILIVLRRDSRGDFFSPSDRFLFMPDRHGIFEIAGLDDPKSQEVIRALRVLRGIKHDRFPRVLQQFQEEMHKTGEKQDERQGKGKRQKGTFYFLSCGR